MNDFGLVQLIWIKRLVSETSRINTLVECNRLSKRDLSRYKLAISSIDDFCAFVIDSQNWKDLGNISKTVDEVEMVLFQHFYEQIDAFEDEEVHLDFSGDDEVNLMFESPYIEDKSFAVIDDDSYENVKSKIDAMNKGMGNGIFNENLEESDAHSFFNLNEPDGFSFFNMNEFKDVSTDDFEEFSTPVIEGDILDFTDGIEMGVNDKDPLLEIFDMKPGESREISLEEFLNILSQNQEGLSFRLDSEAFPDEADIINKDEEVSFEEFIAHIIESESKGMRFGAIEDDDLFN